MIKAVADTHTHSLMSGHAYSTIIENAAQAKRVGLRFMAVTEHAPAMPGAPVPLYFDSMVMLPRMIEDVMIIRGAEVNILDYEGNVDIRDITMNGLEWIIASYHKPCVTPSTVLDHTKGWIKIAENPLIDCIGHCGNPSYAFERAPVLRAFKECGKVVEINAHSFRVRSGSKQICRQVAIECAELGIPMVVSSDAHTAAAVGRLHPVIEMLEEIGCPEELILNADYDRFLNLIRGKIGLTLTDPDEDPFYYG